MALSIGIFTTVTNPQYRGDHYHESLKCYKEFADQVVVVNGGGQLTERSGVKYVNYKWPKNFSWPFIGEQFTRGYRAMKTDWVIRMDLDYMFHERDFELIRKACEDNNEAAGLSFWKHQFVLPDRYNLKSRLVLAVNKRKHGESIRFNAGGDLCQPSLSGLQLRPDDVPEARVPFYNYEKMTKTEKQIKDDVQAMEQAYLKHFGQYLYSEGGGRIPAFKGWIEMCKGRFEKPSQHIPLSEHPIFIRDTIEKLTPDKFGYSGLGYLQENDYVKSS